MDESGNRLIEIQDLDAEIATIEKQLTAYPRRIQMLKDEAASIKSRLNKNEKLLKTTRVDRGVHETEIASKQTTIEKFEEQKMQVTSDKEFQAILHQIQTIADLVSEQETVVLEKMEAEDILEAKVAELKDDLAYARQRLGEEEARIGPLKAEKRAILAARQDERAAHCAKLPEELAEQYEVLHARFPGAGIVESNGHTCGGCNMNLLASTIQLLHESGTLVPCSHCRRMLYLKV